MCVQHDRHHFRINRILMLLFLSLSPLFLPGVRQVKRKFIATLRHVSFVSLSLPMYASRSELSRSRYIQSASVMNEDSSNAGRKCVSTRFSFFFLFFLFGATVAHAQHTERDESASLLCGVLQSVGSITNPSVERIRSFLVPSVSPFKSCLLSHTC